MGGGFYKGAMLLHRNSPIAGSSGIPNNCENWGVTEVLNLTCN